MRRPLAYLALLLALCSCEKIDFSEEAEDTDDIPEDITILGTGKGTLEMPYTVGDIQKGVEIESNEGCWVIGYVVGATYSSIKNAEFKRFTMYDTNILLSSDSLCQDYEACIPVELKTKAMKEQFSLAANGDRFRKCLLIKGWPALYFKVPGLRNVTAGHWLGQSDIGAGSGEPEPWTQDTIPMR